MGTKSRPTPLVDEEARPNVVPMGSFVDPHWPEASGASVNFGFDKYETVDAHPLVHNPSYGKAHGGLGTEIGTDEGGNVAPLTGDDGEPVLGDRAEWNLDDWKEKARQFELPVSGSKKEISDRVLAHEAELANAEEAGN